MPSHPRCPGGGIRFADQDRRRLLVAHLALFALPLVAAGRAVALPAERALQWGTGYVALALLLAALLSYALWRARASLPDDRMARLVGLTVLTMQLIIVPYHALAIPPEADEPHYLVIADSIANDQNLDLRDNYRSARYAEFYPGRLTDRHAIEVGAELYPIRDLGLPLVAAVPFRLAGRPGVLVLLACVAAYLVAQTYRLLRDLRFTPGVALAAVAIGAATHPLLTWAVQIYPDLLVAAAVVTIARLVAGARTRRGLLVPAVLTGTLPWLTTRADFLALGIGTALLLLCARSAARDRRRLAAAAGLLPVAAALAAPLVVLSLVNWSLFGLPMPGAGFYLIRDQQDVLSAAPFRGAVGLLFDRTYGLMGIAPIYLMGFVGAGALGARSRHASGAALAALVLGGAFHFAFVANLAHWHSDWAPASRNFVPLLPLLAVLLAAGIEAFVRARAPRALHVFVGATLGWSVILGSVLAVRPQLGYELPARLREAGATSSLWRAVQDAAGGIDLGRVLPAVVQGSGSTEALSVAWLTLATCLALAGYTVARRSAVTA